MKKKLLVLTLYLLAFTSIKAQIITLLNFAGAINGYNPWGSLYYDGTFLYGMTQNGGANFAGNIFKTKPDGTGYIDLLDFAGTTNGSGPLGDLISDGTFLYGMTYVGGANNKGTLFKIMPNGSGYVKLIDFAGTTNGSSPWGSLYYDGTFLYGMTYFGGVNGYGTIFKIMPNGTNYTKLLDFAGTTNGSNPLGSLISDGTFLYGMTETGGANDSGTIFKIMPNGTGYVNLLSFAGTTNGSSPQGSLMSDGTFLYGMTYQGGTNGLGTIFKMKPNGTGYVKLIDFAGATNGSHPEGSLISDGTFLYGMTYVGGANSLGNIFKIKPDGSGYKDLSDFNSTNGQQPNGSLISDGTFLYGMTYSGGTNNHGTVFKLAQCSNPPVLSSTAIVDTAQCGKPTGGVRNITVMQGTTPYHYQWYNGSTALTGDTTLNLTSVPVGTYSLLVVDANGCTASSTTFFVGGTMPVAASFSMNPSSGTGSAPLSVSFFNQSTGAFNYNWSFGNGSTSSLQNPSTTYTATGTFTVGLIASNGPCLDTSYATIIVQISGIQLQSNGNDIKVYPNPNNGYFFVETTEMYSKATAEVYDVLGQKVLTEPLQGKQMQLSLSNLSNGIYNIRVTNNNSIIYQSKIIKQ